MRTTVNLDETLLQEAKTHASRHGQTLGAFIEAALREALARRRKERKPVTLPVWEGKGGVLPGVPSLDSTSEVLAYLDEAEGVYDRYRSGGRAPG